MLVINDDVSVGTAVLMVLDRDACEAVYATDADTGIKTLSRSGFLRHGNQA